MATAAAAPLSGRRPSFLGTLLAPWINILRPARAATTLLAARRGAFVLTLSVHLLLFAAVLTYFVLPQSAASDRTFAIVLALAMLVTAIVAWLFLPDVHRAGSAWTSYARALRATTSGLGLMIAILWALRAIFGVGEDQSRYPQRVPVDPATTWFPVIVSGLWLTVTWLSRALRAAAPENSQLVLAPRCEGCGYDLTHQSADGRCTECGLAVDASLTPDRLRPGSAWMRCPSMATWIATTWAVLVRPGRFYRALRLRTPGSTERSFAAWHYAAIVVGAGVFMCGVFLGAFLVYGTGPPAHEFLPVMAGFSLSAGLGCWIGHRVIGTLVLSLWLMGGTVPDGRWAAKVVAYESTFLWVFCTYWGLLVISFILFRNWVSRLLVAGPRAALGLPAEPWVVLIGTFALGAVWLWRYHVAHRAIRWNNF